jgi:hypothetical protein
LAGTRLDRGENEGNLVVARPQLWPPFFGLVPAPPLAPCGLGTTGSARWKSGVRRPKIILGGGDALNGQV